MTISVFCLSYGSQASSNNRAVPTERSSKRVPRDNCTTRSFLKVEDVAIGETAIAFVQDYCHIWTKNVFEEFSDNWPAGCGATGAHHEMDGGAFTKMRFYRSQCVFWPHVYIN